MRQQLSTAQKSLFHLDPGEESPAANGNPTCPLTGRPMNEWISMPFDWVKESTTSQGRLYWSEAAQYGESHPRPTREGVRELYDLASYYTHGEDHYAPGRPNTLADRLRIHLAWRADKGRSFNGDFIQGELAEEALDVLEIGAGAGDLVGELRERGHRVVAIEPDASARVFERGFEAHVGTAEDIPAALAGRQFDAVAMTHVLEHCIDPQKALANIRDLLRPGGSFLCEVPNNESAALEKCGVTWPLLGVPRHLNFFTGKSLSAMATSVGLGVRRVFYSGYCRQFSNRWIETQARIWNRLERSGVTVDPAPARASMTRSWKLLASTAFARPERKYDSVGIHAFRPAE